jgi:quercetin dioxygenase-like cupin family protein
MKIDHHNNIAPEAVEVEGALGVTIQWLISSADGAPNFAMRRFVVEPDGHTPYHSHAHEHEAFILSGKGKVVVEGNEFYVEPGSFVFIEPYAKHRFMNDSDESLTFLCMVPNLA